MNPNQVVAYVYSSPPAANGQTLVTPFKNHGMARSFAYTLTHPSIVAVYAGNDKLEEVWIPGMLDRIAGWRLCEAAHDIADEMIVACGDDPVRVSDDAYAEVYDEVEGSILTAYEDAGFACDTWDGNTVLPDTGVHA